MPQYDGTVDEFKAEAANLSDEELEGYLEDDRAGVASAAQAELDSRAGDDADAPASADDEQAALVADKQRRLSLSGTDEGFNNDPDAGQNEVQAKFDEMEISGVVPPTGGPPSKALTVAGVTNQLDPEDDTREAADEAFEALHGRAPGDPVV